MYERKNLDKEARAAAEILKAIKKKQRIEKHQGLNPKNRVEVFGMTVRYDRVLLGATKNNTLVFADIECEDYFSVSFSEVEPITVDDDYLRERAGDLVEYGLSDEVVLEMLKNYDCKPSELVDELFARCDIEEIIDISLYPESFDGIVKGKTIYFESIACGQHDTREYLIPIDKKFTDWLFDMWNKYHLKEYYPKEQIVYEVEDYLHRLGDERQWIENWQNWLRSLGVTC